VGEDALDFRVIHQALHNARAVRGGNQDIDIADRFAAPAVAAGDGAVLRGRVRREPVLQGLGEGGGGVQPQSFLAGGAQALDAVEQGGFLARAEAGQLAHAARLGDALELVQRVQVEVLVQRLDAARAEALDAHEIREFGRYTLGDSVQSGQAAGVDQGGDLVRDLAADAGVLREIDLLRHLLLEPGAEPGDRLRRIAIGAYAEGVLALDFEKSGEALEALGNGAIA